jgi:glucokinase
VPRVAAAGQQGQREGSVPEHLLGFDVGGTKLVVALGDRDGRPLDELRIEPWTSGDAARDLAFLVDRARALLERAGVRAGDLRGIGISAPGPLDPGTGVVLGCPNLPGWRDVPVGAHLARALGAPALVENDANAAAVAEWRHGAGQGAASLVFLTMSTGVGAGLVLDGRLYRGAHFQAGEIGHVPIVPAGRLCGCGMRGCLEAYVGGAGLAARIAEDLARGERTRLRELCGGDPARASARLWLEAVRADDDYALRLLDEYIAHLAQGLAIVVMSLDPERILLGTIVQRNPDVFLPRLRAAVQACTWSELHGVDILPAALGSALPAYAALSVAASAPAA